MVYDAEEAEEGEAEEEEEGAGYRIKNKNPPHKYVGNNQSNFYDCYLFQAKSQQILQCFMLRVQGKRNAALHSYA